MGEKDGRPYFCRDDPRTHGHYGTFPGVWVQRYRDGREEIIAVETEGLTIADIKARDAQFFG